MRTREFNWMNISFLVLSPILALIGVGWYTSNYGVALGDLISFMVLFCACGLAITAGYHRYYSHRTYECHWSLQIPYLLFGAAALENSVLHWSSDHRDHHRFVDTEEDPYNIMRGIFWAHMGWVFYKDQPNRTFDNAPDLKADPLVMWQHKYYLPIAVIVGFGLPTLIGALFGRPFGGFLWGGLLRSVVLQHSTFLINSAAHFFGTQPYSNKDSSRDNWTLAFLTFGEGYHNYHHSFQGDYRNGIAWYHWDPAKWLIWTAQRIGITWRLSRVPEWSVIKAKMEMELLAVKPLLERQPAVWREAVQARLDSGRRRVEAALVRARETHQRYEVWLRETKANARREKRGFQVAWARQVEDAKAASRTAWDEYRRMLKELRRQPALQR